MEEKICETNSPNKMALTDSQLQRMKKNREKAIQLRKARVANLQNAEKAINRKEVNAISCPKDTGAGFFAEDSDQSTAPGNKPLASTPAPLLPGDRPICLECSEEFNDSFLNTHFDHPVCDACRDKDGDHMLMSKTDCKKEYLLKDCDIEKREPPLKFILRKNPHNKHGNMKLYLRLQVEERAFQVHGTEEAIDEKKELLEEAQLKRKKKAFDKKVKALRMEVRSSLYRKKDDNHVHTYGPEEQKEDDVYTKTCTDCGHVLEFEKM